MWAFCERGLNPPKLLCLLVRPSGQRCVLNLTWQAAAVRQVELLTVLDQQGTNMARRRMMKKMDGRREERGEDGKQGTKERRSGEMDGGASVTNKSCASQQQSSSFVFSLSDKQQLRFMCDVTISRR